MAFGIIQEHDDALHLKRSLVKKVANQPPPCISDRSDVFTDGTAFFQDRWDCCIAGSAVIKVSFEQDTYELVAAKVIPSLDHSAYRAESYAILLALQAFRKLNLYVDCDAAVKNLQWMLRCQRERRSVPPVSHLDIWNLIWEQLSFREWDDVVVIKVKAHLDPMSLTDPLLRAYATFNNAVDVLAKKSVTEGASRVFNGLQRIVARRESNELQTKLYHDYLCAIVDKVNCAQPVSLSCSEKPDFSMSLHADSPFFQFHEPGEDAIQQCVYGAAFARRFVDWVRGVEWGIGAPTSGLELYISFSLATRTQCPVLVDKKYLLREHSVQADMKELSLATQSQVWLKMLKWWMRNSSNGIPLERHHSLHIFGYSYAALGFAARAKYNNMGATADALWHYFHQAGSTTRNMARSWCVQQCIVVGGG
eukprot:Skav224488  [mRNA]  locus=scaffold1294:8695:9957:- [translate_table: standard]